MLCVVATLVMVSPYQGKVNGILTLAGQQTKKPEYDKEKTQSAPPRGHMCVEGQVVIQFGGCVVWSLALFLFIGERRMRSGLL